MTYSHLGWNRHPGGGLIRLGGSPPARSAGALGSPAPSIRSGSGAESMSSWVYGCAGRWVTVSLSPPSTMRPAYITMVSSAN
jgi:hypothetical protein